MAVDCDKGPVLDRIEKKLDRLTEVLVDTAVLKESHGNLTKKVDNINRRVEKIEDAPRKAVWAAITAAIASIVGFLFHAIGRG